jgi:hypothetical protein
MPLTPEQLAAHTARQHPCCWLVDHNTQCGLWCGHGGDHTPHIVGDYLPDMPLIQPLHILSLRLFWPGVRNRRCPLCGTTTACISQYDEGLVIRWYQEQTAGTHLEIEWSFDPCGCRARELLPVPADVGSFQGEVR